MTKYLLLSLFAITLLPGSIQAELRVPAATAYFEPDPHGAKISKESGITGWTKPELKVVWYGQLKQSGALQASIAVRLKPKTESRLKLSIAGKSVERTVQSKNGESTTVDFGTYEITKAGYHSMVLESLNAKGKPAGNIQALILDGTAIVDAHFNLKPRRNAASVHLAYPVPRDTKVSAFYCEMTGVEDPLWTYYMACGWHRGYFGMQVNSPTERRIIFSVWDSGNEAVDRKKVEDENRVTLIAKGDGVYSGSFGNEGTGGHSHLKYPWKTGEKQRFLVTANPVSETQTVFAGYYFHPDSQKWMLISSWKAPKEGKYLRGLYSFSENFGGQNGHVVRKALYGNQWIRTAAGEWIEITTANFSHDATGKSDRLDRFMGLDHGQFFLSHGGFIDGFTKFGTPFDRKTSNLSPADMKLPPLPEPRK